MSSTYIAGLVDLPSDAAAVSVGFGIGVDTSSHCDEDCLVCGRSESGGGEVMLKLKQACFQVGEECIVLKGLFEVFDSLSFYDFEGLQ